MRPMRSSFSNEGRDTLLSISKTKVFNHNIRTASLKIIYKRKIECKQRYANLYELLDIHIGLMQILIHLRIKELFAQRYNGFAFA
jgi:hypothetical protein